MKIICTCGEELKLTRTEDSSYTPEEGWYCTTEGGINIWKSHYAVGFACEKCNNEEWIFT
jgi:hypothetical protein